MKLFSKSQSLFGTFTILTALSSLAGCGAAETFGAGTEPGEEPIGETSEAITGGWTSLTLTNGWASAFPSSPSVGIVNGVVTFKGTLVTGSSSPHLSPFSLPASFRPSPGGTGLDSVRLRVALSGNTGGSLTFLFNNVSNTYETQLRQDGLNGPGAAAKGMTSLEGVQVDKTSSDATQLEAGTHGYEAIGWVNTYSFRTQGNETAASAKLVDGFVRFQGFLHAGAAKPTTEMRLFRLPSSSFIPAQDVYVPVSLCTDANTTYGRLRIETDGDVYVEPPLNNWAAANCGVSLEGVSYAISGSSSSFSLATGWSAYSARPVRVRKVGGVVRFEGAVRGSSSATTLIGTLPSSTGWRPNSTIYIVADANGATRATVNVTFDGKVSVTSSQLSSVKPFLSLDGVSFAP